MALFDFAFIKDTAANVAKSIAERQEKAQQLRIELAAVHAAPVAAAELKAALNAWVDETAEAYRLSFRGELVELSSSPQRMRGAGRHLTSVMKLLPEQTGPDDSLDRRFNRVMCGMFTEQVKRKLCDAVDQAQPSPGMTAAARADAVSRIDRELTAVNGEIEQLRRQAQEAGLKLP